TPTTSTPSPYTTLFRSYDEVFPDAKANVPNWRAPHAFSAAMRPGRSSLPRLALLADPESDDIHRPMQGGRDKDDDKEPEQRVSGEKTRDRPRGNREAEHQGADDEIVLVEDGGFCTAGLVHPPFEERPG